MADTIKCPNCSANLLFDADLGKLVCAYCGSSYSPDELSIAVDEVEKDAPAEAERLEEVQESQEGEYQEFVCNACGASVVTDINTSASFCSFCGSPALIGQRLTSEFRPKYIIPFKIGRKTAEDKFMDWCKGGKYTPFGFASDKNIEKMKGIYVPFWLFEVKGHMDVSGTGKRISVATSGRDTITTTKIYDVVRQCDYTWSRIPLDGATRIKDEYMEAIEPFNYSELIPYDYKYIPGFYADRFDLTADKLEGRANTRALGYLKSEYLKTVSDYDRFTVKTDDSQIGDISSEYALLPVWFMSYRYLGKEYDFVINGQTGEVAGIPPVSVMKRILFFALCLGILSIVARILINLLLGGFGG